VLSLMLPENSVSMKRQIVLARRCGRNGRRQWWKADSFPASERASLGSFLPNVEVVGDNAG